MSLNTIVYLICETKYILYLIHEAIAACVGKTEQWYSASTTFLDHHWICPHHHATEGWSMYLVKTKLLVSQWNKPYPSRNMAELNCTVGYWLCPDEQCPSLWLPRLLAPLQYWISSNTLRGTSIVQENGSYSVQT